MKSRGQKVEITCACGCGRKKMVRVADVKRGWGLYFSKSCKAIHQEQRTGQFAAYKNKIIDYDDDIDYEGPGWDAHKDMW